MEESIDWNRPTGAPSLYVLNHPFADGVLEMAGVVKAPEKVLVRIDHKVPPNAPEESLLQRQLMEQARRQGLSFAYGRGMAVHEAAARSQAGDVVLACDPDVLMVGAKGALGLCLSRQEMAKALASDAWMARESRPLRIFFVGKMASDVDVSDVGRMLISRLAGRVTADTVLVFCGGDFSLEERMVLCGMMQKLGVRSALFRPFSGAGDRPCGGEAFAFAAGWACHGGAALFRCTGGFRGRCVWRLSEGYGDPRKGAQGDAHRTRCASQRSTGIGEGV